MRPFTRNGNTAKVIVAANDVESGETVRLMIAGFDSEYRLKEVKFSEEVIGDEDVPLGVSLTGSDFSIVRAFLWTEDLVPLVAYKEYIVPVVE